jgi:sulfite exporter TauE/SafE
MRSFALVGAVLVVLGFATLFLLRNALIRLIIFLLEFLGIFLGFLLIVVGIGMIFAGKWIR